MCYSLRSRCNFASKRLYNYSNLTLTACYLLYCTFQRLGCVIMMMPLRLLTILSGYWNKRRSHFRVKLLRVGLSMQSCASASYSFSPSRRSAVLLSAVWKTGVVRCPGHHKFSLPCLSCGLSIILLATRQPRQLSRRRLRYILFYILVCNHVSGKYVNVDDRYESKSVCLP